jgi:formylglycine-generating enzyme required for sulfatase activity
VALIAVGWAAWYFGIELPEEREAAAAAALRATNARTIPDLNLDLVWIAPGDFLMGTPEQSLIVKWYYAAREKMTKKPNPGAGNDDERPVTWVTLKPPFWLGRTAVTQAQYEKVMSTNPSRFKAAAKETPVETVSWVDAMAFCRKLTERESAAGRLPTGYAFLLPTEAQREYACRAGTTGDFPGDLETLAWYKANSGKTPHLVGAKQPNAWGLYDMNGNVLEWCLDLYADKLPGGEVTNPLGPPSSTLHLHVLRGGCWNYDAANCRSASRHGASSSTQVFWAGFRVALVPSTQGIGTHAVTPSGGPR